jgi:FkbM family methyltransferase
MINHDKLWTLWDQGEARFKEHNFSSVMNRDSDNHGYDFFYMEIYNFKFFDSKCIYEPNYHLIEEGDIVVDLGANIGIFTDYAARKASRVIAVEAGPEVFACLVKNTAEEHKNIEYVNAIVTSSKVGDIFGGVYSKVPSRLTITIKDILEKYNLERINFLKVDIEGFEYDVFNDLDEETLDRIDKISIEVHDVNRNHELAEKFAGKKMFSFDLHTHNSTQKTLYFF